MMGSIDEVAWACREEAERLSKTFTKLDDWIRKMIAWSVESHLDRIRRDNDA